MHSIDKKVKLSNRIYPYFYGLSSDLLFYVTINTMFLSLTKGFSDYQINFFTTFSIVSILIFQPINIRIIKKIGNINSIRLGVIILFLASLIITFSNNFYISLIGFALYEIAFIFKSMENVILKRNLRYLNKDDKFIEIQSKGAFIYSFASMITAFFVVFLFNIDNYLPMYLCISICIINIILSLFLYEAKDKSNEDTNDIKFRFSKTIILILIAYCFGYALISLSQSNSKLFIQTDMLKIFSIEKTSVYFTIIVVISRVLRTVSNLVFPKIYEKFKNKLLFITSTLVIISFIFLILGHILFNLYGIIIMALGYFIYLIIREPFQNHMKILILDNTKKELHEKAIAYFELSKNIQKFLLSLLITSILTKFDLSFVFYIFLILSFVNIYLSIKLYNELKKN